MTGHRGRRWWHYLGLLAASLAWGIGAQASHAATAPRTADSALQVSFEPAASVRLRGDRFRGADGADVAAVNDALSGYSVRIERLFRASSEADLDGERRRLVGQGRRNVPDLNRHYRIIAADADEREQLITELAGLAVVQSVIAEPRPTPPPIAADLTSEQRYRGTSPGGINALAIAGRLGGRGERVKIVDIEYDWNESHEDLAKSRGTLIPNGTPNDAGFGDDHGTAVLGELIGTDNGFGVTGIARDSQIGLVNANTTTGWALPEAVNIARANMAAGDVLLIEQQFDGPLEGADYVAAEYWGPVYDAIRLATQTGIIVVEAAGNGGVNLDAPAYGSPFPMGQADSGAIIVGAGSGDASCAGAAPANARTATSSYGSRVNLQGWGQCVTTTGYGFHAASGPTVDSHYIDSFSGTSSASAIVAGAAALFSSVFEAAAGRPPTPQAVRSRLMATGTPQSASPSGRIGPLPNVLAAVTNLDTTPPTVTITAGPGSTSDTTPEFRFTASDAGGGVTFRCRVGDAADSACTSPHTTAALADGTRTFEVLATDAMGNVGSATRTFTVDTVAPTATIAGPGPADGGPTNDATPTFSFAASEAPTTFECRIDAAAPTACLNPVTLPTQADGPHILRVRAVDAANNRGAEVDRAFTVDTVAPTVTISGGPSGPTSQSTPTFTFSSSESTATHACRTRTELDPGAFEACRSPHTTEPLADGARVFDVRATDAAGNTGPVASRAFSVAGTTRGSSEVETTPLPAPAPAPPPATTASSSPAIAPLALAAAVDPPTIGPGSRFTVTATRTGWVQLSRPRITCPPLAPACKATATARSVAGGAPIGAMTRTVAAGASVTLRFRLTKSARGKLQRLGRLKAVVRIEARHGAVLTTRSVVVTIKRRPRG